MVPPIKNMNTSVYLVLRPPTQLQYRQSPTMGEQPKWFKATWFFVNQYVIQWIKH